MTMTRAEIRELAVEIVDEQERRREARRRARLAPKPVISDIDRAAIRRVAKKMGLHVRNPPR